MNNYISEFGIYMANIWMVWDICIGTAQAIYYQPDPYHTLAMLGCPQQ